MPNYVTQMSKDSGTAYQIKDTGAREQISNEVTARELAIADEASTREAEISNLTSASGKDIINLLFGVKLFRGYYIDSSGNEVSSSGWSTTDYIKINPGYYSIYNKNTYDNYYGMFAHGYDVNKRWVARRSDNTTVVEFDQNDVYCRISIPTSVIGSSIFLEGLVVVNNPHDYSDILSLTDSWFYRTSQNEYVQTFSDNTTAEIKRYTTNYLPVKKGLYRIKIPMRQGATITTFDEKHQPLKNANVLSTTTEAKLFLVEQDGYVVISYTDTGSVELNCFNEWVHSFRDRKVVFYGDSITALGNDFAVDSWQRLLCDTVGIENRISVGVGGSPFGYVNTSGFTLPSGFDVGDNLPTTKGTTTWAEGMPHAAFCAWDRINATVPSDADIIFIMGGTNDGGNAWGIGDNYICGIYNTEEHTFAHDYAWDSADEYTGGDYDLRYVLPSMLSCVMKMRKKAPNAIIILCSPFQRPDSQSNPINHPDLRNSMDDITTAMKKVAQHTGVIFMNLHEGCEVQIYDSSRYLTDGVHPNNLGKMMIARYLISEFEKISNRFDGVQLVELN